MTGGNRIRAAPFADGVGGDAGEGRGGVRTAEALDDGIYGNRHGDRLPEIFSGSKYYCIRPENFSGLREG